MRDIIKLKDLEFSIKNPDFVTECELQYKNFVKSVCNRAIEEGIKIIYLCGQSSSGKTTTTIRIKNYLGRLGKKAHLIELDDFFLPKDKHKINKNGDMDFETIFALDLPAIYKLKKDIDSGKGIALPEFDFKNSSHSVAEEIKIEKDDILILEGIHSFNNRILKTFGEEKSLKIFITVNTNIEFSDTMLSAIDLRFLRRLVRDYKHRNASPGYTVKLWKLVRAGEKRYARGYIKKADIFKNSFLNYEPYLFKQEALKLMEIGLLEGENSVYFKVLRNKLRNLSDISDVDVPNQSILNEFI